MNDKVNAAVCEVQRVKQGEISQYMDTLREEITNLGAEIEAIKNRLNPICTDLSKKTPEIVPDPAAKTDLGESLSSIIDSLRVDTAGLVNVLDSIEL